MMNRLKALYRSWAIPCAGTQVYAPRHRSEWLARSPKPACAAGPRLYYQQLDALRPLRQQVRQDLLAESRKHSATKLLRQIPSYRSDSGGSIDCSDADAASLSHQAATVGLQRSGAGDPRQRAIPLRRRTAATLQETPAIRGLNTNHNHDLKNIFKGAATRAATCRTVPGVLRRLACQRDEAIDGASHLGAQDCGDHFDRLEERSPFRRRISETTSSLSVSARVRSIPGSSLAVAVGFLRRSGSRVSIHGELGHRAVETRKSPTSPYAPSDNQKKL